MSTAKRRRTVEIEALSVVKRARAERLDLAKVAPINVNKWMEVMAKSRNTTPEFVLLSSLPAVAALMSTSSVVQVRPTYSEPLNLYSVVLSPPGAGKSQAFELTVTYPFGQIDDPVANSIVVGDHTKSGLTHHLADNQGLALLGSDELCSFLDNLSSKKNNGLEERALLNKLYDRRADMGTYTCEYGNSKVEIDSTRVCIAGFSQDEEFVEQFMSLAARKDGFLDRLLFAVPPPQLLMTREVDAWAEKLREYHVTNFCAIYQEIWDIHHGSVCTYTFSHDAYKEYEKFADDLIRKLNWQFRSSEKKDVSSKDGRTVIRLAGIMHVLYCVIESALVNPNWCQNPLEIPNEISMTTFHYAMALTEYYTCQRTIFQEAARGQVGPQVLDGDALKSRILNHPGPFVTIRNLTRSVPCSQRPDSTKVFSEMKEMEKAKVGVVVEVSQMKVFLKRKREDLEHDRNDVFSTYITADLYQQAFETKDPNLTAANFQKLLELHPNTEELQQMFATI